MAASPSTPIVLRFGAYDFEARTGELRKQGIRIRLEGQPLAILTSLLKRPGELVTREELQKELWAADTFVDFEHSLNAAIKRLRAALDDSADTPRYIETLARRGYRFIAPVMANPDVSTSQAMAATAGVVSGVQGITVSSWLRQWPLWFRLLMPAALLAGFVALRWPSWQDGGKTAESAASIRSIAVLPLENLTGDASQDYFADGMTDELVTQLAKIGSLRVISRSSVMRFKGTHKTLPEIARDLNVDAVVEGSVTRSAERVRVSAQVIRANPESHLWAESYERRVGDVVSLQGELALAISQAIRVKLTPQEQARLTSLTPVDHEAYEAFLKGRYFWSKRTEQTTKKAIEYFQEATEKDPNYSLAFTGLADSYISLALSEALQEALPPNEAFPKARVATDRALQIDDTLGEAHASLGHIKFQYDRDWSGAEKEFQRAIELNPNYANAHQWYALSLMWSGRLNEALNQVRRAQELDPLSLVINANLGFILSGTQQYDKAIEQLRKTLEMDPYFAYAHYRLGQIYVQQGKDAEAVRELKEAITLSGGSPRATAELGLAYGRLGKSADALKLINQLKQQSKLRYVSPFDFAVIYGGLGDKDRTLEWLQKAYLEHSTSLNLLKLTPAFSNLHSEQRFIELVARVGLPP